MGTHENVGGVFELLSLMADEFESLSEGLPDETGPLAFPAYGRIYDIPLGKVTGFIFQSFGLLDSFCRNRQERKPSFRDG